MGKFNILEIAAELDLDVSSVINLIKDGSIKYQRIDSGRATIEVTDTELDRYKKKILEEKSSKKAPTKEEIERESRKACLLSIGYDLQRVNSFDEKTLGKAFDRRKTLAEMLNGEQLVDGIVKSNLDLLLSPDKAFDEYASLLRQVVVESQDLAGLHNEISRMPFIYSNTFGLQSKLSQMAQAQQAKQPLQPVAAAAYQSSYADADLIQKIEKRGYDFKEFEAVVTRGIGSFIGCHRISLQGINKRLRGEIKSEKKLSRILNKLTDDQVITIKNGTYSINPNLSGLAAPLKEYLGAFLESGLRR